MRRLLQPNLLQVLASGQRVERDLLAGRESGEHLDLLSKAVAKSHLAQLQPVRCDHIHRHHLAAPNQGRLRNQQALDLAQGEGNLGGHARVQAGARLGQVDTYAETMCRRISVWEDSQLPRLNSAPLVKQQGGATCFSNRGHIRLRDLYVKAQLIERQSGDQGLARTDGFAHFHMTRGDNARVGRCHHRVIELLTGRLQRRPSSVELRLSGAAPRSDLVKLRPRHQLAGSW